MSKRPSGGPFSAAPRGLFLLYTKYGCVKIALTGEEISHR